MYMGIDNRKQDLFVLCTRDSKVRSYFGVVFQVEVCFYGEIYLLNRKNV